MPAGKKSPPEKKRLSVEEGVLRLVLARGLVGRGESVMLALSGGADSTCLLYLLAGFRERIGFDLAAAHLDHGMRPEASSDIDFCRRACAENGVELSVGRAELEFGAPEALARRARYDFLARAAAAAGCRVLATAHNLDDQAETILLRLVRGTGLRGLAGIPVSSTLERDGLTLRLVRPLLGTGREEIEAWLADRGARFVTDRTNFECDYLRNRLRREVMPRLLEYNPSFRRAVARLAETAADEHSFLEARAARELTRCRLEGEAEEPGFLFRRADFAALHPALQREMLRQALLSGEVDRYRPGFEKVEKTRLFILRGSAPALEIDPTARIERRGREFRLRRASGRG